MKLYIVRHGETDANTQGRAQGWSSAPLNARGMLQAQGTGEALKGIRFDAAFASPLERTMQTASQILRYSGNGDVEIVQEERLKEINIGDWELLRLQDQEWSEEDAARVKGYATGDPDFVGFPNGESFKQVFDRSIEALREIAAMPYDTVLVVSHGCAIRVMLSFLYPGQNIWHGKLPLNCTLNVVEAVDGNFSIVEEDQVLYDPSLGVNLYEMLK